MIIYPSDICYPNPNINIKSGVKLQEKTIEMDGGVYQDDDQKEAKKKFSLKEYNQIGRQT